ncbi:MAG: hypothetical protein ACKVN9_07570 [Methylophilaceae bacterium]
MSKTYIQNLYEILCLCLMLQWERSAPPDRHKGELDGKPEINSQISRMAYLLKKVAAIQQIVGKEKNLYQVLATHSRRNDGESYISKKSFWMKSPTLLSDGWYFEGGTSLIQKQDILQILTKLGLSATFARCVDDFVAGESVEGYLPNSEEQEEIIQKAGVNANNDPVFVMVLHLFAELSAENDYWPQDWRVEQSIHAPHQGAVVA